jgi:hypothetical protein
VQEEEKQIMYPNNWNDNALPRNRSNLVSVANYIIIIIKGGGTG